MTGTVQKQFTQYKCATAFQMEADCECAFAWLYYGMRKSNVDCKKSLFTLSF